MLAASSLVIEKVSWDGKLVEAVKNEYVLRMPQLNAAAAKSSLDYQSATPVPRAGWSVQSIGSGFFKLTAPGATQSAITNWAKRAGVQSIAVNAVRELSKIPNDTLYPTADNWAFSKISAEKAWDTNTGNRNTIVAVLDTGIDYTHPDLAANMWRNPNEIAGDRIDNDNNGWVDDVYGVNTIGGNGDPRDDQGHGTFCAGLIGAVGDNATGIAGVSWSTQVMAVKIFDAAGVTSIAAEISGIQYVINQRAAGQNIVAANLSYGGYGFLQQELDALSQLAASGVVLVAAAGNDANNNDVNPAYPASHIVPGLISVAASDRADKLAGFSNYGLTSVDLAAPGVNVLSAQFNVPGGPPPPPAGSYRVGSGTSFAAPLVAGTVALLRAIKPTASIQQVKDAILKGVDRIPDFAGRILTGGRLNVAKAVELINTGSGTVPGVTLTPGQNLRFIEGNAGHTFANVRITLDRPVDPGRSAAVWVETVPGGSAASGSDFIPQAGFVTFSGQETEKSVRIRIVGDRVPERDEQFVLKIDASKSKGVTVTPGAATITILDDDNTADPAQPGGTNPLLPVISLASKMQPGGAGPLPILEGGLATFVVSLDRTSTQTISVKYRTNQPVTVPLGTALENIDYMPVSGTLTFRPGERTKEFTVPILEDKLTDVNETFRVLLTDPVNVELAGAGSAMTATITDVAYIPPPAPGFQIALVFPDNSLTSSQQITFQQAASRWQDIIVGDLPDVTDPATGRVIDDILIVATAPAIDGVGGVLGQAGPDAYRPGARGLPWKGTMEFDTADVAALEAGGQFLDVILHEMAHVLGFGSLWQRFNLVEGLAGNNPIYVGSNALREFRSIFNSPTASGVPVQNTGGPGTAGVHWRESVLDTELMTGFSEPAGTRNPISRITIGAMQDLGYQVNYRRADVYTRPVVTTEAALVVGGWQRQSQRLAVMAPVVQEGIRLPAQSAADVKPGSAATPVAGRPGSRAFAALGQVASTAVRQSRLTAVVRR
jgi:subtilisin family serine protease